MSKAVCCLGIYAIITTIIIAILSWIISAEVACSLVTNVTGTDNKIKTSNNYEFLSFDNRKSKDGGESCSSWQFHGIESFEFLLIGVFTIFMIVKGFKKLCGEGGYLQKRKEMKLKRDAAKFEKLKSKFEPVVEKDAKGPTTDTNKGAANNTDRVAIVL